MGPIKHILRGIGHIDGYGSHPGTGFLFFMAVVGGIAGMERLGLKGFFMGMGVMLAIFGPMYLWGAYSRSKDKERSDGRARMRHMPPGAR